MDAIAYAMESPVGDAIAVAVAHTLRQERDVLPE
jgi:hypothetical protein